MKIKLIIDDELVVDTTILTGKEDSGDGFWAMTVNGDVEAGGYASEVAAAMVVAGDLASRARSR